MQAVQWKYLQEFLERFLWKSRFSTKKIWRDSFVNFSRVPPRTSLGIPPGILSKIPPRIPPMISPGMASGISHFTIPLGIPPKITTKKSKENSLKSSCSYRISFRTHQGINTRIIPCLNLKIFKEISPLIPPDIFSRGS